ncbi:nitroreductase family protein [Colwellia sp. BRX10-3]|uniref:nitroreductase family protein n=1 Tax=Colwellia sp. BRX10-3 TaxID=2759844 RepID=UPI0015F635E4|nr:nitroreductase family protein [Colwellia sp. BRX10-3]MBA6390905.1 nitroreductase family protein [Colwellia sp. BRX10-3]
MNVLEFLHTRQSNPHLHGNTPDEGVINNILKAGMRVPDHAGLTPWRFTLVKDEGLTKLSKAFKSAVISDGADEAKIEKAAKMPFRAPLIIVISTKFHQHVKVPKQEQIIAAGCSVHAMQMAASCLDLGSVWRTGEMSYHPLVKERLNIELHEEIVGFLYIGDKSKELPLKSSKALDEYVSYF